MFESHLKPHISFPSVSGAVCSFDSQYAGLPLKSHTVDIYSVSGVSAINIGHNSTANMFGGQYLLNAFIKANISGLSYDTDNKTLIFGAPNMAGKEIYGVFKPNTQYTFYIVGENTAANRNTNIRIRYSDGTNTNIQWSADLANTKQTRVITSTAGKTVVGLSGGNYAGITTLYYDECGAIEGVKTIDDFVAFGGTSYLIQIGSTVNDGVYNAKTGELEVTQPSVQTIQLPPVRVETQGGVNNVFADTGDTTLQYIKLG